MDEDNATSENSTDDLAYIVNYMQEYDVTTESTVESATKIVIDLLQTVAQGRSNDNETQGITSISVIIFYKDFILNELNKPTYTIKLLIILSSISKAGAADQISIRSVHGSLHCIIVNYDVFVKWVHNK